MFSQSKVSPLKLKYIRGDTFNTFYLIIAYVNRSTVLLFVTLTILILCAAVELGVNRASSTLLTVESELATTFPFGPIIYKSKFVRGTVPEAVFLLNQDIATVIGVVVFIGIMDNENRTK